MIKEFLKDTSIYTFGYLLSRGMAFIMLPIFTRLISPTDYGFIDIVTIISTFALIAFTLEINQGFGRYYSESNTEVEQNIFSSTAFIFVVISYLVLFLLFLILKTPIELFILGVRSNFSLYLLSVLYIFNYGIFIFLQNQLRWHLKSKEYVIVSIVFTVASYILAVFFMYYAKMRVEGFFLGMIIGYTIAILLSIFYSRDKISLQFDWSKLKQMLSFSIPLVPSSIGVVVILYIDRLAIKNLLTLHEVGIFGIAYRFGAIVNLILLGFQAALAPLIYNNYKKKSTPSEIEKIFRLFMIIVLSLNLCISVFAKEIVVLFTTPDYYQAYLIIPFIGFSMIFLSMNVFTPGLLLAKKTKVIAFINIGGAVLNTILNYSLIPVYGIKGSASSTLISGVCLFIVTLIMSQKHYRIPFNYKKILVGFSATAIIIFVCSYFSGIMGKYILWGFKIIFVLLGFYFLTEYLIGRKNLILSIRKLLNNK